uniref:Uncharacterized protein n=1 Tax=Glossina palpalis gambiensis TaxID=67801 RepID=A0A1B0C7N8_9MUSC
MKYDKLLETPERKLKFLPWDMPITFNAETANQPGKTATIEMYAPSSYNDTVTGETLSSVSEKSESYSNDGSQGDYIVSKAHSLSLIFHNREMSYIISVITFTYI